MRHAEKTPQRGGLQEQFLSLVSSGQKSNSGPTPPAMDHFYLEKHYVLGASSWRN